ncbi:Small GTP-binding protein domain [Trinorchestia longiramus]|nr:Small GTP-binding protein domain [Trinorchestia longiramus]
MGLFDKLAFSLGLKKREANVLVVGLDNAGKSTVLNHFKPEDQRTSDVVPTVGYNVEKFKTKNVGLTAFDMSGQARYRNLWEAYYQDCQGIIFVVDSSERLRLVVAKEELDIMLEHPLIKPRRLPILFLANKMDLRDAISSVKVSAALGLDRLTDKPWHITACNAVTGDGLHEGIDWLSQMIRDVIEKERN